MFTCENMNVTVLFGFDCAFKQSVSLLLLADAHSDQDIDAFGSAAANGSLVTVQQPAISLLQVQLYSHIHTRL